MRNLIIGSPGTILYYAWDTGRPATLIAEECRQVQPLDVETLPSSGSIDLAPAQFARERLLPNQSRGEQLAFHPTNWWDWMWARH